MYGVDFRAVRERYRKKYGELLLPKEEEPFVSEDKKEYKPKKPAGN